MLRVLLRAILISTLLIDPSRAHLFPRWRGSFLRSWRRSGTVLPISLAPLLLATLWLRALPALAATLTLLGIPWSGAAKRSVCGVELQDLRFPGPLQLLDIFPQLLGLI